MILANERVTFLEKQIVYSQSPMLGRLDEVTSSNIERPISRFFFIPGFGKLRFQNFSEPGNPGSQKLLLKIRVFLVLNI